MMRYILAASAAFFATSANAHHMMGAKCRQPSCRGCCPASAIR